MSCDTRSGDGVVGSGVEYRTVAVFIVTGYGRGGSDHVTVRSSQLTRPTVVDGWWHSAVFVFFLVDQVTVFAWTRNKCRRQGMSGSWGGCGIRLAEGRALWGTNNQTKGAQSFWSILLGGQSIRAWGWGSSPCPLLAPPVRQGTLLPHFLSTEPAERSSYAPRLMGSHNFTVLPSPTLFYTRKGTEPGLEH